MIESTSLVSLVLTCLMMYIYIYPAISDEYRQESAIKCNIISLVASFILFTCTYFLVSKMQPSEDTLFQTHVSPTLVTPKLNRTSPPLSPSGSSNFSIPSPMPPPSDLSKLSSNI